ncbi:MAG: 50S ribosomal protein L28 [bacterium]|nr:50S ribosomal protein L28 [bacterium]
MQVCDLTGKGKQYGHNVSFSQRKTNKVWKPNLQKKTLIIDGKKVKMKLSTQAIRTLRKKGLIESPKTKKAAAKASK